MQKINNHPPELIAAVELALKNKGDLTALRSLKEVGLDLNRLVKVVKDSHSLAKNQGEVDRSSKGTLPDLRTKRSEVVESGLSPLLKAGSKKKRR